jgi:hypothetical protein
MDHIQRDVIFYGDELIAIQLADDKTIYVPLVRLCDNLGIDRKRQARRIRDHPVLSQGFTTLTMTTAGGTQAAQCLRIDLIPLWLSGVNANRVGEPVREKLIRYQAEVATVLWDAFKHDILPLASESPEPPSAELSGAALAYEIATAVQHLARQQMEMEQRLTGRIDKMGQWARSVNYHLEDLQARVGSLELHVGPVATIDDQQAAEIALAVKHVGQALAARGTKPGYSQVYAEMYRRYGISSYKNLPQDKYAEVLAWLRQWYGEVTGAAPEDTNQSASDT